MEETSKLEGRDLSAQRMSDGLVEAQALLSNVRARLQDLRQPDTPAQYDSEVGGLLESVCELRQQMAGLQKRLSGYSRQP